MLNDFFHIDGKIFCNPSCCCCCYWTPPPRGGKLGIPAHRAWNLAARPRQSTSYFPTPVVKPNTAAAGNRTHSGLPVFGLEVRQLRGPRQDSNWVCPRGGLGPHRPPTSILV